MLMNKFALVAALSALLLGTLCQGTSGAILSASPQCGCILSISIVHNETPASCYGGTTIIIEDEDDGTCNASCVQTSPCSYSIEITARAKEELSCGHMAIDEYCASNFLGQVANCQSCALLSWSDYADELLDLPCGETHCFRVRACDVGTSCPNDVMAAIDIECSSCQ